MKTALHSLVALLWFCATAHAQLSLSGTVSPTQIAPTGVAAGSYGPCPNVTINSGGQITAASNGSCAGGASAPGVVLLQNIGSGWAAIAPNGTAISCAASTTSCFQEAVNYAQTNGYNVKAVCPTNVNGGQVPFSGTLVIGPADGISYDFRGCSLVGASTLTAPLLIIDTLDMGSKLDWGVGRFYNQGVTSAIVQIYPHTLTPQGGFTLQNSEIDLPYMIAGATVSSAVVEFTEAPNFQIANYNKFIFLGEDGNATSHFAQNCIQVDSPPNASAAFVQNVIDFGACENIKNINIFEGTTWPLAGPLGTNIWTGMVGTTGAAGYGIATYGYGDQFYISSISINSGTLGTGVLFQAGSSHNYIVAPQVMGNIVVNDSGTGNCGIINAMQKLCGSSW